MEATVLHKQIFYIAETMAMRKKAVAGHAEEDNDFKRTKEGAKHKAKEIHKGIQNLRKLSLKRRGPASAQLAQMADELERELKAALLGGADA